MHIHTGIRSFLEYVFTMAMGESLLHIMREKDLVSTSQYIWRYICILEYRIGHGHMGNIVLD